MQLIRALFVHWALYELIALLQSASVVIASTTVSSNQTFVVNNDRIITTILYTRLCRVACIDANLPVNSSKASIIRFRMFSAIKA